MKDARALVQRAKAPKIDKKTTAKERIGNRPTLNSLINGWCQKILSTVQPRVLTNSMGPGSRSGIAAKSGTKEGVLIMARTNGIVNKISSPKPQVTAQSLIVLVMRSVFLQTI